MPSTQYTLRGERAAGSHASDDWRVVLKRALQRALGALAWGLVALLALLLSLGYHLQLDLAGVVAVQTVTTLLDREIQGSIEITALHNISYEKIVARGVVIRDPEGREVIRADRVAAWPVWGALFQGAVYIERVRLRGGRVTLIPSGTEESPSVSIAETFLPTEPSSGPPDPNPLHITINGIVLDGVDVQGDVPGFDGIHIEELRAEGRVDVAGDAVVHVYDGRLEMVGPYRGRTHLDEIVGSVDSDLLRGGVRFWARGHRQQDRIRALFRLWQEEGAPSEPESEAESVAEAERTTHMDLRVTFDPVRMATLAEMEVAPGLDNLAGVFRGSARLGGPVNDLRLTADVTSEAGRAHVRGHLPTDGPLTFDVWTQDGLRLERLVPLAPAMRIDGRGRLTLERGPGDSQTIRVHAETESLSFQELTIPSLELDGTIEDDALELDRLFSDVAGGETTVTGSVGFDGSLDVHVVTRIPEISREPNVAHFAPEARGALRAELDVRADAGLENPHIDGRLSLRNARYGSSRAGSLSVRGHLAGVPPAPVLRITGEASGLQLGELRLGEAAVSLRGGPGGYAFEASSADGGSGTRVTVEGRAVSREDRLTLDTTRLSLDLGDGSPWRGQTSLTLRHGHSVAIGPLRLSRGDEALTARGTYRFNGPDDFDVTATNLDLVQFERFAPGPLEGLRGRADGHLVVSGDIDRRPQGQLDATVRDGSLGGLEGIALRARLSLEDATLRTDVRVDLGDNGGARVQGDVQLTDASLRDPARIASEADLSGLEIEADDLSVAPLLALAGSDASVAGRITTSVSLAGSPEHPQIEEAVVVLDHIGLEGWDPLRLKALVAYRDGRARIRQLWIADDDGELLEGRADLPLSLEDPPTDLRSFWRSLNASTWSANVLLPPRRLESWPRPLSNRLPPGILLTARLDAYGDASGPHATYAANARVVEIMDEEARCSAELNPQLTLTGSLEGRALGASLRAYAGSERPVVVGQIDADLPLDEWIAQGDVPAFPATEVSARIRGAEMSAIPYVCQYGSGPIFGTVIAKDILTADPVLSAVVELPRVRVWERAGRRGLARLTEPFRVHARAGSTEERDALTACVILGLSGTEATEGGRCRDVAAAAPGELITRIRVPVAWTPGRALPALEEGSNISSWSDFNAVHVAPVVGFIPGIVGGDAVIAGRVRASGPWEEMRLGGALDVSEGHVQIEGLGQHLYGISGRIELHGDEAVFPADRPLTASDSGGRAEAQGRIGFEGLIPRDVDLSIAADSFPIRREGMVLAWLSGAATVGGRISDEETSTTVTTHDFTIRLPERTAATLQSLDPHPQILVVGSERVADGALSDAYAVRVQIDATDPFVVHRNDFSVTVTAALTATYADPELRIGGSALIRRGNFEIFGKSFALTEGRIAFGEPGPDGRLHESAVLDPQVRVVADYAIPRSSDTVTVTVSGSLTDPRVEFTSTATDDQAEIISLLVSGGRRRGGTASQAAEEQATSFLAGLTAGILTLGLRQELGDVIPVLAIESQGLGGTRIRAGFSADALLPQELIDAGMHAYVEGFVNAAAEGTNAGGSSSGGGGVGGGVTIEVTFQDAVLRGTYLPVDNGSLDLVWEP